MQDYFRVIAKRYLLKPFLKTGLSANQITILNFSTLGLLSIVLFFRSLFLSGLLVAGLFNLLDYVDGEVARATTGNTKEGKYLDTSLDWLYLMFLIFSISYASNTLKYGTIAIIVITYGNWVEHNANVSYKLLPIFNMSFILTLWILVGRPDIAIAIITGSQISRTIILYWRSMWKMLS